MLLRITLALCCAANHLANALPTYHRPYYHERTSYVSDGRGYGNNGYHDHDEGGNRQLHQSHASHGASDFGDGEGHSISDRIKQDKYNQGAHSSKHESGGKEEHAKKSHDKGFYEREKKYGYEKSYGYEKETKSHDKASQSHSQGSGYNHKDDKGQHSSGEQFLRDLADEGKKFKRGSQSHGSKSQLFDSSSHHSIGKDIQSELARDFKYPNLKFLKRSGPLSNFAPNFIPKQYMFGVDKTLQRFKNLSGIHGLGGLRAHGLNYGYNPLRYRFMNGNIDSELMSLLSPLFLDIENPKSKIFYYDPEV